jgi:ABC-type lipoprotein export system ATPase subunit
MPVIGDRRTPVVLAQGLGHWFEPNRVLFDDVHLSVSAGEVMAVTGPSGSGKSTLLGIVAGVTAPAMGVVSREGIDRIAWVFQNPHGVPARTALDHVVLALLAAGARRRDAEPQALDLMGDFGLRELAGRRFADLSGGEAQRLMLARAVACVPQLLLVDEPTAQLDPTSAIAVADALRALAGRGAVVLVATHDERLAHSCTMRLHLGAVRREES